MASDCVFCKIVDGRIPAGRIREDALALSFMDIAPVNRGHVLVIPKRHVIALTDLTRDELVSCITLVQDVAKAVLAATGWPGFNVLQNNHACAGQVVAHCHFHVIPRSPDDGMKFGWRQLKYGEGELEEYRRRIVERLS